MIFWFSSQILEDRLLPVSFHEVPVIDHTVSNGIMNPISRGFRVGDCFMADEEVEVFDIIIALG